MYMSRFICPTKAESLDEASPGSPEPSPSGLEELADMAPPGSSDGTSEVSSSLSSTSSAKIQRVAEQLDLLKAKVGSFTGVVAIEKKDVAKDVNPPTVPSTTTVSSDKIAKVANILSASKARPVATPQAGSKPSVSSQNPFVLPEFVSWLNSA